MSRNNLPPSSSLLLLPVDSLVLPHSFSPFLTVSLSPPLSLKRRLCQCQLAADYRCNHSSLRWSDSRKGLQIILTPPPQVCWTAPEDAGQQQLLYFCPQCFSFCNSGPRNSPRKAKLEQCLGNSANIRCLFQCNVSPGFSCVSRLGHNVSTSGVDVVNFVRSGSLLGLLVRAAVERSFCKTAGYFGETETVFVHPSHVPLLVCALSLDNGDG